MSSDFHLAASASAPVLAGSSQPQGLVAAATSKKRTSRRKRQRAAQGLRESGWAMSTASLTLPEYVAENDRYCPAALARKYNKLQAAATDKTPLPQLAVASASTELAVAPPLGVRAGLPSLDATARLAEAADRDQLVPNAPPAVKISFARASSAADDASELELVKTVVRRERLAAELGAFLRAQPSGALPALGSLLSELVDGLRDAGIAAAESIARLGRRHRADAEPASSPSPAVTSTFAAFATTTAVPPPFMHKSEPLARSLVTDLDFLDGHVEFVKWLGFRCLRNPLLVPAPLLMHGAQTVVGGAARDATGHTADPLHTAALSAVRGGYRCGADLLRCGECERGLLAEATAHGWKELLVPPRPVLADDAAAAAAADGGDGDDGDAASFGAAFSASGSPEKTGGGDPSSPLSLATRPLPPDPAAASEKAAAREAESLRRMAAGARGAAYLDARADKVTAELEAGQLRAESVRAEIDRLAKALEAAKANAESAQRRLHVAIGKRRYGIAKELQAEGVVAAEAVDRAELQVKAARCRLFAERQELRRRKALLDGLVAEAAAKRALAKQRREDRAARAAARKLLACVAIQAFARGVASRSVPGQNYYEVVYNAVRIQCLFRMRYASIAVAERRHEVEEGTQNAAAALLQRRIRGARARKTLKAQGKLPGATQRRIARTAKGGKGGVNMSELGAAADSKAQAKAKADARAQAEAHHAQREAQLKTETALLEELRQSVQAQEIYAVMHAQAIEVESATVPADPKQQEAIVLEAERVMLNALAGGGEGDLGLARAGTPASPGKRPRPQPVPLPGEDGTMDVADLQLATTRLVGLAYARAVRGVAAVQRRVSEEAQKERDAGAAAQAAIEGEAAAEAAAAAALARDKAAAEAAAAAAAAAAKKAKALAAEAGKAEAEAKAAAEKAEAEAEAKKAAQRKAHAAARTALAAAPASPPATPSKRVRFDGPHDTDASVAEAAAPAPVVPAPAPALAPAEAAAHAEAAARAAHAMSELQAENAALRAALVEAKVQAEAAAAAAAAAASASASAPVPAAAAAPQSPASKPASTPTPVNTPVAEAAPSPPPRPRPLPTPAEAEPEGAPAGARSVSPVGSVPPELMAMMREVERLVGLDAPTPREQSVLTVRADELSGKLRRLYERNLAKTAAKADAADAAAVLEAPAAPAAKTAKEHADGRPPLAPPGVVSGGGPATPVAIRPSELKDSGGVSSRGGSTAGELTARSDADGSHGLLSPASSFTPIRSGSVQSDSDMSELSEATPAPRTSLDAAMRTLADDDDAAQRHSVDVRARARRLLHVGAAMISVIRTPRHLPNKVMRERAEAVVFLRHMSERADAAAWLSHQAVRAEALGGLYRAQEVSEAYLFLAAAGKEARRKSRPKSSSTGTRPGSGGSSGGGGGGGGGGSRPGSRGKSRPGTAA